MNALHTRHARRTHFDWAGQVRLGIALSVAVVLAAVTVGHRLSQPVFVVTVIVVSSLVGWSRVAPVRHRVTPVRHRDAARVDQRVH
jgi:uncharacterized membrane protein YfcA